MRRGRPKHDDILTPREWDVLRLIGEGLTNEEIATRLAISENTAKYHVAEILSKLDVPDRRAAASWFRHQRSVAPIGLAGLGSLREHFSTLSLAKTVSVSVGALVGVGLVALLVGVLLMERRTSSSGSQLPVDRRTGDEELDELISVLLSGTADSLRDRFKDAPAQKLEPGIGLRTLEPEEWVDDLAAADRQLYAVVTGHPQQAPLRDIDVVLSVISDGRPVAWTIALADGNIVDLQVGDPGQPMSSSVPGIARQFDRYIVLPPKDDLPVPPKAHPLGVSLGDAGVDALLRHLKDPQTLLASLEYEMAPCGPVPAPACPAGAAAGTPVQALPLKEGVTTARDPRLVEARLADLAAKAYSLQSVVKLPDGYRPAGDHLLILVTQEEPYRWEVSGLVEHDGHIVGLVASQGGDNPAQLYPATAFILPPPASITADGLFARRSGHSLVDAIVNAMQAGDVATLASLIDYERVGCVTVQRGIGAPPLCAAGEALGTQVEVVIAASCEGHYVRRDEISGTFERLIERDWYLYAVEDLGDSAPNQLTFARGRLRAILGSFLEDGRPVGGSLSLSERGITAIGYGCGVGNPEAHLAPGRTPNFLLPPP